MVVNLKIFLRMVKFRPRVSIHPTQAATGLGFAMHSSINLILYWS